MPSAPSAKLFGKPAPRALRAALYLRVSTGRQAEGDVSLPSQRDRTRRFCEREVVSTTQPTGTDPSQEMMRQIIGIFDEYTSKENGKQVIRAMRENARQNFWNGASPPLGYRIVEAERRGQKIKKRLEIDPVEREVVQLMFWLYAEGDPSTDTPPLGIKQLVTWLNARGYTTKRGGVFGVGPTHHILTNTAYVGCWRYNVRSSKTGEKKPEEDIVEIGVPVLIDPALFDRVQAELAANNPKVTAPRMVSGPILLTGLATCAHCGGGMTQRTGTSCSGKTYSYYACASRAQKGAAACKGNSIPMRVLDEKVTTALKERLFNRERLAEMLSKLAERRAARASAVSGRLVSLQAEVSATEQKQKRLYHSIAEGIVELDELLREQIALLKGEHEKAKAALDRARAQSGGDTTIAPERIEAFSSLMLGMLANTETQTPALKAYLRSVLGSIIVGDKTIRITGNKDLLASAITGQHSARANVRGFEPEWRTRQDSNL